MGLSPWRSPVDVWMEKTGHPMWRPQAETPAMRWGKILEPVLRAEYSRDTGLMVIPPPPRATFEDPEVAIWDADGIRFCHPDGLVGDDGVWEGKTGSDDRDWEHGVPVYYRVQVQQYSDILGRPWSDVSVLLPRGDFRTYREEADPAYQAEIRDRVRAFWADHVEKKIPPDGTPAVVRTPEPESPLVTLRDDPELAAEVGRWLAYQQDIDFWTEALESVKERIRDRMGGAAYAEVVPGYKVYFTSSKGKTTVGWEQVATSLWNTLEMLRRQLVYGDKEPLPDDVAQYLDSGLYDTLVSMYTVHGAPTRPLSVRAIKEGKSK